jgi:TRAP-type C4-dicarboxylate transport system substrate-binding protein
MVAALICGGCSKPSTTPEPSTPTPSTPAPAPEEKPVTLSFVSFLTLNNFEYAAWAPTFIDAINEKSGGKLTIEVKGGPEVVPPADLALAVSQGQVDIIQIPTGYTTGIIPGLDVIRLSEISIDEERKNGTYDYIRELSSAANMYFVGRQQNTYKNFFYNFFADPVKSPSDMEGRIIAGSASFFGGVKAINAVPKMVALPDYYQSLESSVCDGIATAIATWGAMSLYQVAPYCVDVPYYRNQMCIMVNMDTWNKLPDDMKALIAEVQLDAESKWPDIYKAKREDVKEMTSKEGAEFITFSDAENEKYISTIEEGSWTDDYDRFPKDVVEKFESLIRK